MRLDSSSSRSITWLWPSGRSDRPAVRKGESPGLRGREADGAPGSVIWWERWAWAASVAALGYLLVALGRSVPPDSCSPRPSTKVVFSQGFACRDILPVNGAADSSSRGVRHQRPQAVPAISRTAAAAGILIHGPMSMTEFAERVQAPRSTVYRWNAEPLFVGAD